MTTIEKEGALNLLVISSASNVAADIMIKVHPGSDIIPPCQFNETKKAAMFAILATHTQAKYIVMERLSQFLIFMSSLFSFCTVLKMIASTVSKPSIIITETPGRR